MPHMAHGDSTQAVSVFTKLLEAWNRRSAEDFAMLFETDGSVVGFDGSQMNGRNEIASTLKNIFDHHATARFVGMVPPGATELNPAVNAVQSLLFVERHGDLRIALLHNTPAAFHGRPELATQLTEELSGVYRSGRVAWSADVEAASLGQSSDEPSRR